MVKIGGKEDITQSAEQSQLELDPRLTERALDNVRYGSMVSFFSLDGPATGVPDPDTSLRLLILRLVASMTPIE